MRQYLKMNRVLLVLLAAAVAVSLWVIARRWSVESENKTYDVVLDYTELELMAEQSDHDVSWWLEQFRDMGITRVGLTEESLTSLMENSPLDVTATVMDKVIQDANWRRTTPLNLWISSRSGAMTASTCWWRPPGRRRWTSWWRP